MAPRAYLIVVLAGILWPLSFALNNFYRNQTRKIYALTDDVRLAQEARQAAKDAPKTFAKVK